MNKIFRASVAALLIICMNASIVFSQSSSRVGFAGGQQDADTGIVFYNNRPYIPELGRFITPDGIVPYAGNPQAFNRYSYCANNPTTYVDPTGHGWWFAIIAVAKAIGAWCAAHPVIAGAAIGAASGATSSAISGANSSQIWTSTWQGGLAGGIMGAVMAFPTKTWWGSSLKFGLGGAAGSAAVGADPAMGFAGGLAGGVLTHAGFSIASQNFFGAGLAGKLTSSAGYSALANSVSGKRPDSRYSVFFGPLSVSVGKGIKPSFGSSGFFNTFYFLQGMTTPGTSLSIMDTISSGSPVFQQNGSGGLAHYGGRTMGDNIFLASNGHDTAENASGINQYILGHERIHAGQGGAMAPWGSFGADMMNFSSQQLSPQNVGGGQIVDMPSAFAWQMESQAQQFRLYGGNP